MEIYITNTQNVMFFKALTSSHQSWRVWLHRTSATHTSRHWCTARRAWCTGQRSFGAPPSCKPSKDMDVFIQYGGFDSSRQQYVFGDSGRFDQTAKCLTLPSGLFGVLTTMAFVRGVNLLASSSAERTQSPLDRLSLPLFCVEPKKTTFSVILYCQK